MTTLARNPGLPAPCPTRRQWLLATAGLGGAFAVTAIVPFISSMQPSERAKAAGGPIEIDISRLAPGTLMVAEWRSQPVWILHRTPEMIEALQGHESRLVDPDSGVRHQPDYATNATRSVRPEIFVAIGICTHLGCSPTTAFEPEPVTVGAGWPGGFICPCHGSTFDLAGRVFKDKPAPTNLVVPPHHFVSDSRLVVGEDARGTA